MKLTHTIAGVGAACAAGLAAADAYLLCSVAAHLRLAEVVDLPNVVVACELDLQAVS